MTVSVNAATTVTKTETKSNHIEKSFRSEVSYAVEYKVNETAEWCWVDWTVTITWSDGTTSSYSGTTGSANGCAAAISTALGTIGQIIQAVM